MLAKSVALSIPYALQRTIITAMSLLAIAPPLSVSLPAIACPPPISQSITIGALTWRNPQLHQSLSYLTDPNSPNNWDFRVALSPDGKTLVGGDRTTLTVWDVETGEQQRTIASFRSGESEARLGAIAFSPNGQWVAVTMYDADLGVLQLGVWDVTTGAAVMRTDHPLPARAESHGSGQPVTYPTWSSVIFSPDGRRIATVAGGNPQVDIWEVASGEVV